MTNYCFRQGQIISPRNRQVLRVRFNTLKNSNSYGTRNNRATKARQRVSGRSMFPTKGSISDGYLSLYLFLTIFYSAFYNADNVLREHEYCCNKTRYTLHRSRVSLHLTKEKRLEKQDIKSFGTVKCNFL